MPLIVAMKWFWLALLLTGCASSKVFYRHALWAVESPDPAAVQFSGDSILMDSKSGVTLWWRKALRGNYEVEYRRTVLVDEGPNDRLSDFNQFWMAAAYPFQRSGVFESYDDLSMYYLGLGGNYNTTSRFRKYDGLGNKPLLDSSDFRLEANRSYWVRTRVIDGIVEVDIDGVKVVRFEDKAPLKKGYFGLRTTWSRHSIKDFKIRRL
jgi:hypothetical protein